MVERDYHADAIHWQQEAEQLRAELCAANERGAQLHADLERAQTQILLLESTLRSVAQTAANYVSLG